MKEELSWIFDDLDSNNKMTSKDESAYERNRNFIHSLGLKCDYVGWVHMNLSSVDYISILKKAAKFCEENGCKIRGNYHCSPEYTNCDWYVLKLPFFKSDVDWHDYIDINGQEFRLATLAAYKEHSDFLDNYVSENFLEIYKKHNMKGLRFCWAQDTGKYASKQYFGFFCEHSLSRCAVPAHFCYEPLKKKKLSELLKKDNTLEKISAIGGALPKIYKYFYNLTVYLPNYYPKNEMPENGFVYSHTYKYVSNLLIHKDYAKILLEEKIISTKNLEPALFFPEIPITHEERDTFPSYVPSDDFINKRNAICEEFKKTERPLRQATEKQALSVLRKAKKQHPDYIQKKITKEKAEKISATKYAFLVPYYLVSAGGSISDEYHLLDYEQALIYNNEFAEDMKNDDIARKKLPLGTVFGICANGDKILCLEDGKVVRISHEDYIIPEEWPSVAQFIFDCSEFEDE